MNIEQELQKIIVIISEVRFESIKKENQENKFLSIQELGMTENQAQEIRASLSSFAEDWDAPEMDIYDEGYVPLIRKEL